MGAAIGQVLAFAVGVALVPIPIVAVILILATPRGRSNGLAFVAGWIAGLTLATTILLLLAGGTDASEQGQPATWVNVLKLILGGALLIVAARQWRRRPRAGEENELPGWARAIDRFTAGRATALGVGLSALNPKNLLFVAAAASAIAQVGAGPADQAVAVAVFVLVGTAGVGIPVAVYLVLGERSRTFLDDLKRWMSQNNATIIAVLCVAIAAKLIGDAIAGFSA
ncbi:MAG: GAP family protein [Solirubrobacterales bacterium]